MKIRIKGNAVRFRLTKMDVDKICTIGFCSEETNFNTSTFLYTVKTSETHEQLTANFENNTITMYLPIKESIGWKTDNRVGFRQEQILENGKKLALVLEKDFQCLDERGEDESDNYPNPKRT